MTIAPYAADPAKSRGREFAAGAGTRGPRSAFQRDRDRIIHSTAFRRLRSKTQVFIAPDGDFYRTRLTHSLEVAQIARVIARSLGLDEDLTEALALAHDIGHPPFGHAGERALAEAMAQAGGYDHNAHALRIVARLESPYCDHDGLNLTWDMLEGMAKHNGPMAAPNWALAEVDRAFPLELGAWPSLEAQVANIADDIAYDNHDIDDGLRAGLFAVEDLKVMPLTAKMIAEIDKAYPRLDENRRGAELVRELISYLIGAVFAEAGRRLQAAQPKSADEVRNQGDALIAFSAVVAKQEAEIKSFLKLRMYRHPRVMRVMGEAEQIVFDLFARYQRTPGDLPVEWLRHGGNTESETEHARRIGNFIAGMTDRFAITEHQRLFDSTPDLR
jgi:dGTPase